ncbi:NADPH-dependent 2,4-dienoyl-CoA reductase/sulfur reductase-like enzyme [Chitinivorax tropicus]|uniref:NADPH-dependent 2,4-dienoyl-CoA reductase/sulfur reductase-like enzyme n=2 Tax=Chitinivorax tropicus TaxID=714531 RepID=A0A840MV59_9PROT|nr:FAD-dependent oxidoreductase [Chitinivorax tropicus]MBB5019061.1 NADPH-dependent 2,4-dienoyl-CoA reductase/sulfur reductase-like enzyme [Chitinivorax tropicus]
MREIQTELAIIGSGPAGLAAASVAIEANRTVCLVDNQAQPGGQIWRGGLQSDSRAHAAMQSLAHSDGVRLAQHTLVAALAPSHRAHALLLEGPAGPVCIHADRVILANGARERHLPFPGWTLPGVTGAGGLQALVKGGWPIQGQRVVVAGSGPLLLASARTVQQAGGQVTHILEQASQASLRRFTLQLPNWPGKAWQALLLGSQFLGRYRADSHVVAAHGTSKLEAIEIKSGNQTKTIACDHLAIGYGLIPNTDAAQLLGCELTGEAVKVDSNLRTTCPGVYAAGEVTGIGGVDKAWVEGHMAACAALALPVSQVKLQHWKSHHRFSQLLAECFALNPALMALAKPDTLICRCEDVSLQALAGFEDWREAKLQTRCGMGACQGRTCGAICQQVLGWASPGLRPPVFPAKLATLAALADRPQPETEGIS